MEIKEIVAAQRAYFNAGKTLPVAGRVAALNRLRETILRNQDKLNEALMADLNKSPFETYMSEVGLVLDELRYVTKMTPRWARDNMSSSSCRVASSAGTPGLSMTKALTFCIL